MIKQYLRQAFQMLRENRLISVISILGTAIAIAMIMVVVLMLQVQVANYYPENNRDRMLFVELTEVRTKGTERNYNQGGMSPEVAKECFYGLSAPEAVTAYYENKTPVSPVGRRSFETYSIKLTDAGFWRVFNFRFLEGQPFTEADLNSAVPQAVISKQLARKLFGEAKAVGREIMVDQTAFRVCGVVADVSKAASVAYGDLWVPYTTFPQELHSSRENMVGPFKVAILARNTEDFEAIRQELSLRLVRYNSTKQENEVRFYDYPVTQWDKAMGTMGTHFVDPKKYWLETGSLFLFLLLVPVLNLLGVTQSSVRKRQAEIGVRKAFGASRWVIVCQLLFENGVITLLGGFVGLILSLALFPFCKDFMLPAGDVELSGEMLFRPTVFLLALLFCLLFNLLSVGMPAWWIVRKPIYEALRNGEETNK